MAEISLRNCAIVPHSQMITPQFRQSIDLEGYFHLGDRMVHPVLFLKGQQTVVVDTAQVKVTEKWYITAIKLISYITIIIPLIVGILILTKRNRTTVQTHVNALTGHRSHQMSSKIE